MEQPAPPITDAHVAHLLALGERFVIGGPFLDANDRPVGSLVVIEADSAAEAEAFAAADPFVLNGVYGTVTVRRWEFGHLRAGGKRLAAFFFARDRTGKVLQLFLVTLRLEEGRAMAYWLMKSEPDVFSYTDLENKPVEEWHGVRNSPRATI